jgi:hypothetical protein
MIGTAGSGNKMGARLNPATLAARVGIEDNLPEAMPVL